MLPRPGTAAVSARLRDAIAESPSNRPRSPRVGSIVGVEHEFVVRLDGRVVDFRSVIHDLPIPGQRIDAADGNAYRGPWGGTITTDGPEAEIATPPVTVGPAAAHRVAAIAAAGARELEAALPRGATLEGYSTHLSVEVPRGSEERTAREVVARWAPILTWLLDGPSSPGLLVRPRPGRVEIGGDFVDGGRLGLAAIVAVGAVRAAFEMSRPTAWLRRWRDLWGSGARLPALAVHPAEAVERYGWFVGDAELGAPLHAAGLGGVDGRGLELPLAGGGRMIALEQVRQAWVVARTMLGDVDPATIGRVDGLLDEHPSWPGNDVQVPADPAPSADASLVAWVSATRHHIRPTFVATPAIMSWDFVVLRLRNASREAYACLPRVVLGGAMEALDAGRLDVLLGGYLEAERDDGRILASAGQTNAAAVFKTLRRAADLVTTERGPQGGGGKRQRSNDHRPDQSSPSSPPVAAAPSASLPGAETTAKTAARGVAAAGAAGLTILGLPAAAAAAAVGITAVAVVGGAMLLGGGHATPSPLPGPTGAPTASADAVVPTAAIPSSTGGSVVDGALEFGTATIGINAGPAAGFILVPFQSGGLTASGGHPLLAATWGDESGRTLFITIGSQDASGVSAGTYATGPDVQVGFRGVFENGNQLDATILPGLQCSVDLGRTTTGGITGTWECTGTDPTYGAFSANGQFNAEPPDVPGASDEPFVQDYDTGTAEMHLTGDGQGSASLRFANEQSGGAADGQLYPIIVWADDAAQQTLGIYTLTKHATGTLSTDDGTLGVGVSMEPVVISGAGDQFYSNGIGLGHDPVPGTSCAATIAETPTGGISGTLSCSNINGGNIVIGLEATFSADYAQITPGDSGGVIVTP